MINHAQALARGRAPGVSGSQRCTGMLRFQGRRILTTGAQPASVYQCDGCGTAVAMAAGLVCWTGDIDDMPGWWSDETPEGQAELASELYD